MIFIRYNIYFIEFHFIKHEIIYKIYFHNFDKGNYYYEEFAILRIKSSNQIQN